MNHLNTGENGKILFIISYLKFDHLPLNLQILKKASRTIINQVILAELTVSPL